MRIAPRWWSPFTRPRQQSSLFLCLPPHKPQRKDEQTYSVASSYLRPYYSEIPWLEKVGAARRLVQDLYYHALLSLYDGFSRIIRAATLFLLDPHVISQSRRGFGVVPTGLTANCALQTR